jgi:hypothetical protein
MVLLLANYSNWAINHASGLRLNKKANYLKLKFVIVPPGFDALADIDSFSIKLLRPYLLTKKNSKIFKYTLSIIIIS